MNGVAIGDTRSGVGKTVATLALIRALQNREYTVQAATSRLPHSTVPEARNN
ncbi:hypothetical protein [Halalkalicoccus sp. NIPERK01]|uniref:nucleotide-binding protein n=1 Tax=Halalkalicoccus sp. NIPERK01 TaxID=3053469 RepID=UPI0034E97690